MKTENIQCPVCGYYCLGNGGNGCINKPKLVEEEIIHIEPEYEKDPTGILYTLVLILLVIFILSIIN